MAAQRPQFEPVVQPADLRARAFVRGDDPMRGQGVQRGQPSVGLDFSQDFSSGLSDHLGVKEGLGLNLLKY